MGNKNRHTNLETFIMNIGIFYQSGFKFVACYMAVEQFRKHYPDAPIALFEDNSDILKPIADKFSCDYKKTDVCGTNGKSWGRPIVNLSSNLAFLKRINEACNTTLKNVDHFIIYEDDVWCLRKIQKQPKFDLSGANGPIYNQKLSEYLFDKFNTNQKERGHWSSKGSLESYQACGGTIINRLKFIEAYKKINEINWEMIKELDSRPLEWSDASLSFVMQHAGFSCGRWEDWGPYEHKNKTSMDKSGWLTPFSEGLGDFAFLHYYKHYYSYNIEELDLARAKVLCEERGFTLNYQQN